MEICISWSVNNLGTLCIIDRDGNGVRISWILALVHRIPSIVAGEFAIARWFVTGFNNVSSSKSTVDGAITVVVKTSK